MDIILFKTEKFKISLSRFNCINSHKSCGLLQSDGNCSECVFENVHRIDKVHFKYIRLLNKFSI